MEDALQFLLQHGYAVLFFAVLIDQIGFPLPVLPLMLAAGALIGTGDFHFLPAMLLAAAASALSHVLWYELGRRRGSAILGWICKISFEPDACVRRAEDTFVRYGKGSLLVSKFIPGLNAVAAPVAGVFKMSRFTFMLLNTLGSCLWATSFIGLGYLFRHQLEDILAAALRLGGGLIVLLVIALTAYIGYKYVRRYQIIKSLRVARITPEELKQKLDAQIDMVIIDLRHAIDVRNAPRTLPGAIRMAPEELPHRHREIPPDREIILFCT